MNQTKGTQLANHIARISVFLMSILCATLLSQAAMAQQLETRNPSQKKFEFFLPQKCPANTIVLKEKRLTDEDGSGIKQIQADAQTAFEAINKNPKVFFDIYIDLAGKNDWAYVDYSANSYTKEDLYIGLEDLWDHPSKTIMKREITLPSYYISGFGLREYQILKMVKAVAIVQVMRAPTKDQPTIELQILAFPLIPGGYKEIGIDNTHIKEIQLFTYKNDSTKLLQKYFFDKKATKILQKIAKHNPNMSIYIFANGYRQGNSTIMEVTPTGESQIYSNDVSKYFADILRYDLSC